MARSRKTRNTETKIWLRRILTIALIDMQIPFVLAFLGREQIAEDLGKVIAAEIVGVFVGYLAKSYFETKEEEKTRLKEKQMDSANDDEEVYG